MRHARVLITFAVFTTLLAGCATTAPKVEDPYRTNIMLLEKQIAEANRKLEEIYHRISVIQFMVDNHQRTLRDMERLGVGKNDLPGHKAPAARAPQPQAPNNAFGKIRTSDLGPSKAPQTSAVAPQTPAPAKAPMARLTPQPPPAAQPAKPPKAPAVSAETLYRKALAAYQENKYSEALPLFMRMAQQHPTHDLADNALYWAGECHYAEKRFQESIQIFKNVVLKYPDGSKVPDALLKTGYAYLSVNDKANARIFLKEVIKSYPFSKAGGKAEQMLKKIRE